MQSQLFFCSPHSLLSLIYFELFFDVFGLVQEKLFTLVEIAEEALKREHKKACAIENRITNQSIVFTAFLCDRLFEGKELYANPKNNFLCCNSPAFRTRTLSCVGMRLAGHWRKRKNSTDIYCCSIISAF